MENTGQRLNEKFKQHGLEPSEETYARNKDSAKYSYLLQSKDFGYGDYPGLSLRIREWAPKEGSYVLWVAQILNLNYSSMCVALFNDCKPSQYESDYPGGIYKVTRRFLEPGSKRFQRSSEALRIRNSGMAEHYDKDAKFVFDDESRLWIGGEQTQGCIIPVPVFILAKPGEYGTMPFRKKRTLEEELKLSNEAEQKYSERLEREFGHLRPTSNHPHEYASQEAFYCEALKNRKW